ncbi:carboxypeptidase-like protein [Dyadobacter jejuensis]|uniref:Carboxypeptidase-like protein n=1 Tax=Dyadobacter jejuensis TaxID=1082580 RepID=A0A316B5J0_9BACT|nr:TonB-dependent receptor [Dyadobacter jejuensis]PWJ57907.1 carboxypeptidase-like protein [Dyadobacter jejuensis]
MAKTYTPAIVIVFVFMSLWGHSQGIILEGVVHNASDTTALPGAIITLQKEAVENIDQGTMANEAGKYRIGQIPAGAYTLKASFIGFKTITKDLLLINGQNQVLDLFLEEESNELAEVKIVGQVSAGAQNGDTTAYNADAFKTTADASAQELIEKLPGITMENGKVQAQGEDIQQILVDGKQYFGADVAKALQNLPAEVIASIELYDKQSDKSEMSGFDDGQRQKTINIVTKPNRRNGQFGKASAGYGSNQRYAAGASVNVFDNDLRLTFTGLTNNVNTTTYQTGQSSQGDDKPNTGVMTTNSFGVNYSGKWSEKIEASGSYTYTQRHNTALQTKFRNFVNPADSGRTYQEQSTRIDKDRIHQANMRIDFKINERNRILFRPNLNFTNNDDYSYFTGQTNNLNSALNETENKSIGNGNNVSISNSVIYSHRFSKPGRSLSFRMTNAYRINDYQGTRESDNVYFRTPDKNKTLNQLTKFDKSGYSWEVDLSYSEPIGSNGRMQLSHERGNRVDDSDKRLLDYQEVDQEYTILNTGLSNTFKSEYLTQKTEWSYQYRKEKLRIQVAGQYQSAKLVNNQIFPTDYALSRTFDNVLPSAKIEYRFSKTRNLQLDYRTSTDAPSINELQQVYNIYNPLYVRTGNPNLVQSTNNKIQAKYKTQNPDKNSTFFAMIQSSIIPNYQTNSTFTARSPIALTETDTLQTGSQLSMPVNLNGYWNISTYVNYGQPINWIKSKVSFNTSVSHSQLPSLIDSIRNMTYTSNFRLGTSVSSNISEFVDFQVSTRSGYSMVKRSLRNTHNNSFNQNTRLRLTWILWKGLVYRTDLIHTINTGLSAGYNTNYMIWNMTLGKKLFANRRGEISLNVFDLLKQNVSIKRNIADTYVQDTQSNVLQRYFLLTFTYNIRRFPDSTKGQLSR